eukprot:1629210-Alexandrium_andersonii.AAC.1
MGGPGRGRVRGISGVGLGASVERATVFDWLVPLKSLVHEWPVLGSGASRIGSAFVMSPRP